LPAALLSDVYVIWNTGKPVYKAAVYVHITQQCLCMWKFLQQAKGCVSVDHK